MRLQFYLGHPAHFHLLKNVILSLKKKGHETAVLIKKKDILEKLLKTSGIEYKNILSEGRGDSKFGILIGMLKRDIRSWQFAKRFKPDLLTGTSVENSHLTRFMGIPSININEDDAAVVPLYARLSYPWASEILTPIVCNSGKWNEKTIKYEGYHELAYLHPNHFKADKSIVEKYFSADEPYFIIRFAKLKAHHDTGINGINSNIAEKLLNILKPHGKIYITSERKLEPHFESYRMAINPLDIHHVMAYAKMYIGDSQTMAAEAGVLGTPFIRFNDFVGKIGYLEELENKYELGFGIKTNEVDKLLNTIKDLVNQNNLRDIYQKRRQKMLSEKIDYAAFLVWFIENYPKSVQTMKDNPDYQYNFK